MPEAEGTIDRSIVFILFPTYLEVAKLSGTVKNWVINLHISVTSGASLHTLSNLSKLYDVPVGFVTPNLKQSPKGVFPDIGGFFLFLLCS